MVIPIYLFVLAALSVPLMVIHGCFWSMYQSAATDGASWGALLRHNGAVQVLILAAEWAIWRALAECLFIFEHLRLLLRPYLSAWVGVVAGLLYGGLLLRLLVWYWPSDMTIAALWGQPAWWLLWSSAHGLVCAVALCRGYGPTPVQPLSQWPNTTIISGEMPLPITEER